MVRRRPSGVSPFVAEETDEEGAALEWPFGRLDDLTRDDFRAAAYEIFFTAFRSAPGIGSRSGNYDASADQAGRSPASSHIAAGAGGGANMSVNSRIKKSLGLRTRRAAPMRVMSHLSSPAMSPAMGGGGGTLGPSSGKLRQRPMTSAEIMRQQLGITEHRDNCLRKTLVRTVVGQGGKKAETIILPLELLRHLKPSDFSDMNEYHHWQRRQLKILEAGLLLHPSVPLDRMNSAAIRFAEVIRSSAAKPIDTGKNSEAMRTLCNSVMALAWRSNGVPGEVCHWADGYPLNVYLYLALLRSVFDRRDETVVLDEVDELLELIKKTWSTFGINRMVHNACFAWILFEQYIVTGQVEPDLISATLAMLVEVANDAKRQDREPGYVRVLSASLGTMQAWAEKRLLEYHEWYDKGTVGVMENVLGLALLTSQILSEDASSNGINAGVIPQRTPLFPTKFSSISCVEQYVRSSLKSAFTKVFENGNGKFDSMVVEVDEDPNDTLVHLAKEVESLAVFEKENYSCILKRWHPVPVAVSLVTLHTCYGIVLKQHLSRIEGLTNEVVRVLHIAGKLEKMLVQMAVEESADAEAEAKMILREMVPYEVDSIIVSLLRNWIDERLRMGRECVTRAKDTESWNPKSKTEPYAQSAVDLMKLAKVTVDEFFEIQVGGRDDLAQTLAEGLDSLIQDYTSFVASCGSKQSYSPALPPLTRCNQDSMMLLLWKAATPCKAGIDPGLIGCKSGMKPNLLPVRKGAGDGTNHPRPTVSRGTQRLYVRLNTLHYLLGLLHSIDKSLSFFSRPGPSPSPRTPRRTPLRRRAVGPTHFDLARSAIHSAILHVAEVAAHRLIFLDSAPSFYDSLYVGGVGESRIRPTLRSLKQNLSLLVTVLSDRAQPLAVREIMKASFEAFLLVVLAGGPARAFYHSDYGMVMEDLANLKRIFCTCGEGLVTEEVVQKEAAGLEGVVALMSLQTEKLVEDFTIMACEASGLGRSMERVPMPPTTGRWSRTDANTVLRVLCHRNDDAANRFLKKAFDLPKRK
ncbi:protein unc-13 homolog [Zingiber officinale]|uniref:protein unc-13 homolog n=1 Tax=Zingiber officinale TaxID=94328 RepID=UPI001C4DD421|nr:protein unc-13 homolog [Zingiber officinale]